MIVDGIERDMSYLSPDEIETFTILKDASATAPYGIRGANGVIIVTTKRGRKGEKPTVDSRRRSVSANRSATPTTWVRQAMRPSTTRRCSTTTLAGSRLGIALLPGDDQQLPPRQGRQLRRPGLQLGLLRLRIQTVDPPGLQPFGTRRHRPRPLFHPRQLLQPGRQLQAFELRQRQQVPAL